MNNRVSNFKTSLREVNASLQAMCDRLAQADAQKHRKIIALPARVEALEVALTPFTQIPVAESTKDHETINNFILAYHVRKARAALKA